VSERSRMVVWSAFVISLYSVPSAFSKVHIVSPCVNVGINLLIFGEFLVGQRALFLGQFPRALFWEAKGGERSKPGTLGETPTD